MASSSDQGSHMPEITGICCAALQMRPCPVFPVMTSSLVPEWDLKGAVPEQGGLCTAGMPGCAPWWPCAQLLLCQTWSKCSDDKIVRAPFFSYTISLLCSGKVICSHHGLRAGGCQGSTDTAIMCGT